MFERLVARDPALNPPRPGTAHEEDRMTITAPNPTYAAAARRAALELLPPGTEVFIASSRTAETIELTKDIDGTDR